MNRDRIVTLSFFLFVASCDGSTNPGSGLPFASGRSSGVPEPLGADASHAYAGRVTTAMLPTVSTEIEELRVWDEGDFILANDEIAVVIEDVGMSDHFDPWGGKIVGLGRVEGGAIIEPAQFYELGFTAGRFTMQTRSVTIMESGANGGAARVRAIGRYAPIPFIDDTVRNLIDADYSFLWAAMDYVLEPGARHVDVNLSFFAEGQGEEMQIDPSLVFALQAYSMKQVVDQGGFGSPPNGIRWAGYVTPGATGYAVEPRLPGAMQLMPGISLAGASLFYMPVPTVPLDPEQITPWARIHVGGPDSEGLVATILENQGTALRTITGSVTESDGLTPVVGAEVHARIDATRYLTRAITDQNGTYSLRVPATVTPELFAYRRGSALVQTTPIATTTSTADLAFAPRGTLDVTVRDADSQTPMPAKVQVRRASGETPVPGAFGVEANGQSRVFQEWTLDGRMILPLDPGTYHVTVSRGPEYDILSTDITVTGGQTVTLPADLAHDVATPGVLCGDFHLHTNRSPDAPDSAERKLRSAAGEGLEIPVRSDHEWTTDFEAPIAELGLGSYLFGLSSLELTTYWWGHFGVFPLAERDDEPNGGAIPWYDAYAGEGYLHRTPQEVFDATLAKTNPVWGEPTIIVNHPRSVNTPVVAKAFAYFAAMGYDPTTGTWEDASHDERFQLIEVFNDSDFDANYLDGTLSSARSGTVNDWFSFLENGLDMYAVGSSDSHGVTGSPVGYPRTCIRLGVDSTDALRMMANGPGAVRDAMLAGRHSVSGGVFVETFARYASASPVQSGGTVTGASANEAIHVRVQAPSWVDVDQLRVFVDGQMVDSIVLDGSSPGVQAPAIRFEGDILIPTRATGRSWVVVVADGDMGMDEVYPNGAGGRRPFGVTNPIFFTR